MNKETSIQNDIRNLSGKTPGLRLFRNFVGTLWQGRMVGYSSGAVKLMGASKITCGLAPGSSDLIGWKSITITPDMVGKQVAVFTSIEVKQPGEKARPGQDNWLRVVAEHGGIAGVATSPEQAMGIIEDFKRVISMRKQ